MRNTFAGHALFLLLFIIFVFCSPQRISAKVQANLDNITIADFLKFTADYTGLNIVYREDQLPGIKLSLYSKEPITESELKAMLRQVLQNHGFDMVAKGEVIYVQQRNLSQNFTDVLTTQPAAGSDDEIVTTLFRLPADLSADKAAKLVAPFVTKGVGIAAAIPEARALIMKDKRERVSHMIEILEAMRNLRAKWTTEVLNLRGAQAAEARDLINSFYAQLIEKGHYGEAPLVLSAPWTNNLIVAGTKDQIKAVRKLLKRLEEEDNSTSNYKIYKLRNAKASSVSGVLNSLVGKLVEEDAKKDPKAAPKTSGKEEFVVSADEDTNTIIVLGDPDVLADVDAIVGELDSPQDQVFVEALILETSLAKTKDFGVEWLAGIAGPGFATSIGFVDSTGLGGSSLVQYQAPVLDDPPSAPNFGALPGGFSVGALGNVVTYEGVRYPTLSALVGFLKTATGVNILSTPQILTLNNSEAEIFVGENRAFLTGQKAPAGSDNTIISTFEYRDIGVRLNVTPHINSRDNLIRLDIIQDVEDVIGSTGDDQPITLNRNTKTSVQLVNGATMVIGGLVQDDLSRGQQAVPGASKVPVLGWLFKKRSTSSEKRTLMLFITARIVRTTADALALGRQKLDEARSDTQEVQEAIINEFDLDEEDVPELPEDKYLNEAEDDYDARGYPRTMEMQAPDMIPGEETP
jgi:general secretion pathway protein D